MLLKVQGVFQLNPVLDELNSRGRKARQKESVEETNESDVHE